MNHWKMSEIRQGLHLRSLGLSYNTIAIVLGEYHGVQVTGSAVRAQLRTHGATPFPRGRPENVRGGRREVV